jgi:hypothetical protein
MFLKNKFIDHGSYRDAVVGNGWRDAAFHDVSAPGRGRA